MKYVVRQSALTASNIATTFSGGTLARMLWTCWKTKPPPGRRISTCRLTCSATCLGVAIDYVALGLETEKTVFWRQSDMPEVAEHVKRQVEILQPEGGFVFQQVHNILANVPAENIVAMFEAVNA